MSPTPLKYGKLECTDNGLTYLSHPREPPATIAAALGLSSTDRPKTSVAKYRKSWWEAQVRLYDLKCTKWTIDGMKEVLTKAIHDGLQVPAELKAVEEKLILKYLSLDKENCQPESKSASSAEPVDKSMSSFALEMSERSNAARARQLEKMNRLHAQLLATSGLGEDISGTWQFDCPRIVEEWGCDDIWKDSECIWKIPKPNPTDECIWLNFDQIVVEGIMCIEWNPDWRGRKLEFLYRGRETGEMDVQCEDELNRGWITFTSEGECHGEFGCQFFEEPYKFEGKKISLHRPKRADKTLEKKFIQYVWHWEHQRNVIII